MTRFIEIEAKSILTKHKFRNDCFGIGYLLKTLGKLTTDYYIMKEKNLVENGLHHEIYLSDLRKVAPEKMRGSSHNMVQKVIY